MTYQITHCPNRDCSVNSLSDEEIAQQYPTGWFVKNGTHSTRAHGSVQRFKCRSCGKTFSTQTFSTHYYTKKRISLERVSDLVHSSTSIRDMARLLNCSRMSVDNRIRRCAHQLMAADARIAVVHIGDEVLVIDGFESFVLSKYHPNNINLAVGESRFIYNITYAYLNRKGVMTPAQKEKADLLKILFPIAPGHLEHSVSLLLEELRERFPCLALICSDEKIEYRLPIQQHFPDARHLTVSSHAFRGTKNPLFPVNFIDRLLRKDLKEHVRSTSCPAKRVNQQLERIFIHQYLHNFRKPFLINDRTDERHITHAIKAGIAPELIRKTEKGLFMRRAWFSREEQNLSETQRRVWLREFETPEGTGNPYNPKFMAA